MKSCIAAILCAALIVPGLAQAHASLAETEVSKGAASRLTLRIPHGCGSEATLAVRIRIPEGLVAVKPMPKAGWTLEIKTGAYGTPQKLGANTVAEGVQELIWTGELPDAHYDEFVFRGTVADGIEDGARLYIPAVQECATGTERWIEIPSDGGDGHHLDRPAPSVTVVPATGHHH